MRRSSDLCLAFSGEPLSLVFAPLAVLKITNSDLVIIFTELGDIAA
jgi:hypothetical protein